MSKSGMRQQAHSPIVMSAFALALTLALLAPIATPAPAIASVATTATTATTATDSSSMSPCAAAGVIHVHPGSHIQRIVDAAPEGATVCFGAGSYRMTTPIYPHAGQTLIGNHATLTGARVLSGFTRTSRGWTIGGQTQQGEQTGTCVGTSTACHYPDDVLRDGRPLKRVVRASHLTKGSYYFDYARNRITLHDSPRGHAMRAMVAPAAIVSRSGADGANVTVTGFTITHFASLAQHGAIDTTAPGWLIENNTVEVNHGSGIRSDGHVTITHNRMLRNGQLGVGGSGSETTVTDNEIAYNNTAGFDGGWEAGGGKWAVTDGLDVEDNSVHDNNGPGLWTDIDGQNTTYAGNVVTNNARAGIFLEISAGASIRDNVVTGNGHSIDDWLWGSGILIAGSHDVAISGNTLKGNAEGIGMIQAARGTSDVDGMPRTIHNIAVSGNTITVNGTSSGAVTDDGFDSMFSDPSITWTDNTWHRSSGNVFDWNNDYLDAAAWRALGHDVDGTFD